MCYVVAATSNPAKLQAIQLAFDDTFGTGHCHTEYVDVASGVSLQPLGTDENSTGAHQRVIEARKMRPEADFWVGVEAGVEKNMTFASIKIENPHTQGELGCASLMLPETILQGIRAGRELGSEMADITGNAEVKRQGGAICIFTNGQLSHTSVYHQALLLALVPFHNPIYQQQS